MEQKLYVLGYPVAHSKSPVMHNALYKALGLPWRYSLMACETALDAQAFLDAGDFLGINITMPYKPLGLEVAAVKNATAVLAQGANVLLHNAQGALECHNLDGVGCVRYMQRENVLLHNAQVVVCGTGPTSRAIMHAAAKAGAAKVTLMGRNAQRAHDEMDGYLARLAQTPDAGLAKRCVFADGSYETDPAALQQARVIVDATPLGMMPGDPAPFSTMLLHEGQFVMDVVYGHGETALAAGAKASGCRFANGAGMLVSQAVLSAQEFLAAAGLANRITYEEAFDTMARAAEFGI
ncbi:MAG: shikimate dehydrogenase [Coriobacteriia bacterium]|nr:shikimate dehydrogenase [Coriobacteriia bacterium]